MLLLRNTTQKYHWLYHHKTQTERNWQTLCCRLLSVLSSVDNLLLWLLLTEQTEWHDGECWIYECWCECLIKLLLILADCILQTYTCYICTLEVEVAWASIMALFYKPFEKCFYYMKGKSFIWRDFLNLPFNSNKMILQFFFRSHALQGFHIQ